MQPAIGGKTPAAIQTSLQFRRFWQFWQFPQPLPKTRARRDNICLTGTYLVPLEPRTLLTNS